MGERGGDAEDRQGFPFVGPAGRILDEGAGPCAGTERPDAYVTNVVKRTCPHDSPRYIPLQFCGHKRNRIAVEQWGAS
ncbi:uracil-DNA glycosylase family protein [Geobacter sp. DSM 9736]|uniref:uracil-DNA glycosylase family protein n=1 Tax=Geobacter sp. DSM 9736 TaxID=1277350 RepID=UPI0035185492